MMNPFAYLICRFRRHKWRDTRDTHSRWTCKSCGLSTRKIRF